jgi:predicted aldo/keto reductase-like oxidoreductase
LQLNYVDWSFQDGKAKMALLEQRQIPAWVMEPLRGGKLATLPVEYSDKLNTLRPNDTAVTWAFRFLQSQPGIVVTLSGMSDMEQLRANIEIYESDKPLNERELNAILGIADDMVNKIALPCTACNYCTAHCPQQLNIPDLLALFNEHYFTDGGFIAPMALMAAPKDKQPAACIGCRSCESVCPQSRARMFVSGK